MKEKLFINIGILSGGKSSRMGQDKARLEYRGTSFMANMVNMFSDLDICSRIIISSGHFGDYELSDLNGGKILQVSDSIRDYGPIEGLFQILNHSDQRWTFITAIDMPFMTRDYVEYLVSFTDDEYDMFCDSMQNIKKNLKFCKNIIYFLSLLLFFILYFS